MSPQVVVLSRIVLVLSFSIPFIVSGEQLFQFKSCTHTHADGQWSDRYRPPGSAHCMPFTPESLRWCRDICYDRGDKYWGTTCPECCPNSFLCQCTFDSQLNGYLESGQWTASDESECGGAGGPVTYDWGTYYWGKNHNAAWYLTGETTTSQTITTSLTTSQTTSVTATSTTSVISQTTSVTATSTSSVTLTSTTSTPALPPPGCFSTHTACPLPARSLNGTWEIVGSEGMAECMVDVAAGETMVFNVTPSCHTPNVDVGGFTDTTTTFRFREVGTAGASLPIVTLEFGGLIECLCRTRSSVVVGSTPIKILKPQTGGGNATYYDSTVSFETHTTEAFKQALQPGENFPGEAPTMYFRVSTPYQKLILGISQCIASPSDSPSDPDAVVLLGTGCKAASPHVQALLQMQAAVPENETNTFHFSAAAFKFVGSSELHVRCDVLLCSSEPCGVCASPALNPARRLRALSGDADTQSFTAWSRVSVESSPQRILLPRPVSDDILLLVWTAEQRMPARLLPINVTLLGLREYTDQMLETLAASTSAVLSTMMASNTIVARIHAVSVRGLLDSDAEALVMECAVGVASAMDGYLVAARLTDTNDFNATFMTALQHSGMELPSNVQAAWTSGTFVADRGAPTAETSTTTLATAATTETALVDASVQGAPSYSAAFVAGVLLLYVVLF